MAQFSPSLLAQIAKAKVSGGGTPFRDGKYLLSLLRMTYEDKHSGQCLIAEWYVESAERVPDNDTHKTEPNRAGSVASTVINFTQHKDVALGNTKAIILALLNEPEDSLNTPEAEAEFMGALQAAVNTDPNEKDKDGNPLPVQPMRGFQVAMTTFRKMSRGNPQANKPPISLTLPKWKGFEQDPAAVATKRAWLDSWEKAQAAKVA